jgi:ABC-type nitrate/sulfonate/bicarbonate transport system substrate-binding protein/outer membrane protein OmpA-like peptidoglycan-associated protein
MAVTLKTHTKVMLAMMILAVSCAGAWHLGLKDLVAGSAGDAPAPSTDATAAAPAGNGSGNTKSAKAIGTAGNPLKVSIVSWHGYAPGLVANGNSLTTQPGSIYEKEGLQLEFLLQDDLPPTPQLFGGGIAQCAWRTIDFFAQEQPALRDNKLDARVVMVVDNSRGSDAIIAKGDIGSVEDLAGKRVGLTQFTPSHMVTLHAIEQSLLTERKKKTIQLKFLPSVPETRAALESGAVDAAVLWEPDTSLALKKIPGAKVVYSTETATNLIYDVMVCDKAVIDANPEAIQKFVTGWMKGAEAAEADPNKATAALQATEPMFADLIKAEGAGFMNSLYKGVKWTTLADNVRVFGLAGGTNSAEAIYAQADKIWRENTDLIAKETAIIPPAEGFDLRFIQKLADADAKAKEEAQKPEFTFSDAGRDKAVKAEPALTKPVSVNFGSGSAELSKRAQDTIDKEVVPLLDSMGGAYFSVEGNTDSTGGADTNKKLSSARAQAVVDYLVKEWEFPRERFKIAGNGSAKPLCDEKNPAAEELTPETCLAANRRTDVAVFSR